MALADRLTTAGFATETLESLAKTDQGEIWSITSPGGQPAIDLWHKLRSQIHVTMHTPIVIGETSSFDEESTVERLANPLERVEAVLRTAAMTDGKEILDRRAEESEIHRKSEEEDDPDASEGDYDRTGEWPVICTPTSTEFNTVSDTDGRPFASVTVALVPTIASWMAPAYLQIGGWNACPSAEDHVSVLKYWTRLHATDVFAITHDAIEVHVTNPPTTRDQAMRLAREQYAYCPDVIEQGSDTIANLAATLLGGRSWFFWWD